MRQHTANSRGTLSLSPATVDPIAESQISIAVEGDRRTIRANGISKHKTGSFPNQGNPNSIAEQNLVFSLPASPSMLAEPLYFSLGTFGIGVNGVVIDPQAAEWYLGEFGSIWQYDPLGGAVALGLDENFAHVQPDGLYHYHAKPTGLLANINLDPAGHSPIVGWAMDGNPIYAFYGWDGTGAARELASSWVLRSGARPSGDGNPGGVYDGTFVADYDYVEGAGDLDQCNGRFAVTPEFPDGSYAYFITDVFPFIPRCFFGQPIDGAVILVGEGP